MLNNRGPTIIIMNWYNKVLENYVTFTGRARRKEYWMFILFNAIFCTIAAILDNLFGTSFQTTAFHTHVPMHYGWIYMLYALFVFLPTLAVGVRRLHDIGKSGWSFLIGFIPIFGPIILLIWFCKEGNKGDNEYGSDPKTEDL